MGLSRHTALRTLLRIPLPTGRVPRMIGVGDFALRRRHLWHNLCEAALSEVKAHSTCWAAVLDAPI